MKTYSDIVRSYRYWTRLLIQAFIISMVCEASFSYIGSNPFSWWAALRLFLVSFCTFALVDLLTAHARLDLGYMLDLSWCRRFHRQHHEQFSTDYAKLYYRCKKCDHHFSKLRP